MMDIYFSLYFFALGSIVGSFLNVCIFRLPQSISIFSPRSFCPHCHEPIKFYDNIPILSFILLKGKCRSCKKSISIQYPAVESFNGLLYGVFYNELGICADFFIYSLFASSLLVISVIDLRHRIIPDVITIPGIFLGLLTSSFSYRINFLESFIGTILGGGLLLVVGLGYELFRKKEGMGGGDVKLLAMIGSFLGWKAVLLVIFVASLSGSIIGILWLILKGKGRDYAIPFGPYLSLGALCYLFWGETILRIYGVF